MGTTNRYTTTFSLTSRWIFDRHYNTTISPRDTSPAELRSQQGSQGVGNRVGLYSSERTGLA